MRLQFVNSLNPIVQITWNMHIVFTMQTYKELNLEQALRTQLVNSL